MENLVMRPIIGECAGCPYIDSLHEKLLSICRAYQSPESKWRDGHQCPLKPRERIAEKEKFVDPIKASKRTMKGKTGKGIK